MRSLILFALLTAPVLAQTTTNSPQETTIPKVISPQRPGEIEETIPHNVYGKVQLKIDIDAGGHVTNVKALTGDPRLVNPIVDVVRKWVYSPATKNGQPIAISVMFDYEVSRGPGPAIAKDEPIAWKLMPLLSACQKSLATDTDLAEQLTDCKASADVAETLSPKDRFVERREAFVFASNAYRRNKQLQEALDYANKAIAVVDLGHDDAAGSSIAYTTRVQAESYLGNLAAADRDLTQAEAFQRTAVEAATNATSPAIKATAISILKALLNYHANVLTKLNNSADAKAKSDEAAKL